MNKTECLKDKTKVFESLLEKYSKTDEDAAAVLNFMKPLFSMIQWGGIAPPVKNKYRWYFASTESPLYRKYDDLSHAASEYSCALEDWNSQEWFHKLEKNLH
jgi:hypothetical protein